MSIGIVFEFNYFHSDRFRFTTSRPSSTTPHWPLQWWGLFWRHQAPSKCLPKAPAQPRPSLRSGDKRWHSVIWGSDKPFAVWFSSSGEERRQFTIQGYWNSSLRRPRWLLSGPDIVRKSSWAAQNFVGQIPCAAEWGLCNGQWRGEKVACRANQWRTTG